MTIKTDTFYSALSNPDDLRSLLDSGEVADAQIVQGVKRALQNNQPEAARLLIQSYRPDYLTDRQLRLRAEYWLGAAKKLGDDSEIQTVIDDILTSETFADVDLGFFNNLFILLLKDDRRRSALFLRDNDLIDPTGQTRTQTGDDRPLAIKVAEKFDEPDLFHELLDDFCNDVGLKPDSDRFENLVQRCYQEAVDRGHTQTAKLLRDRYDTGESDREMLDEAIEKINAERARAIYERLGEPDIDSNEIISDFVLANDYLPHRPEVVELIVELDPDRTFGEPGEIIYEAFRGGDDQTPDQSFFDAFLNNLDPDADFTRTRYPTNQRGGGSNAIVRDVLFSGFFDEQAVRQLLQMGDEPLCLTEGLVKEIRDSDWELGTVVRMAMDTIGLNFTDDLTNTAYNLTGVEVAEIIDAVDEEEKRTLLENCALCHVDAQALKAFFEAGDFSTNYLRDCLVVALDQDGLEAFDSRKGGSGNALSILTAFRDYGVTFDESVELSRSFRSDLADERSDVIRGILTALSQMGIDVKEQDGILQQLLQEGCWEAIRQCAAHDLVSFSDSYNRKLAQKNLEYLIERRYKAIVHDYLDHGGDVSSDEFYQAIEVGDEELLDHIIESYNARVDVLSRGLNRAVKADEPLRVIERLLAAGAELNYDVTPVPVGNIITSEPGVTRGVEALRYVEQHGGDVTDPPVVKHIAGEGAQRPLQYLLSNRDIDQATLNEAMVRAVRRGRRECLRDLLEAGAQPDYNDYEIFTKPIGSVSTLEVLTEYGADLTAHRQSVLMHAAVRQNREVCEWLVAQEEVTLHERALDPVAAAMLDVGGAKPDSVLKPLLQSTDSIGGLKGHPVLQDALGQTTLVSDDQLTDYPISTLFEQAVAYDQESDRDAPYPVLTTLLEAGLPLEAENGRFLRYAEQEGDQDLLDVIEPYKRERTRQAEQVRDHATS